MTETTSTQKLVATPGQTIGPFYGFALPYEGGEKLVDRTHPGAIRLHGTVYDGEGVPIPDSMLEIWQADEQGNISSEPGSLFRDGYTFTGWGRQAVDGVGAFNFTTVNPCSIDGKAPFISLVVFARGLLNKLHTRIYLPDDEALLAADPLLQSLPEERRRTLIATREESGDLRFDVRLQGANETVFLTYPNTPK
ncbi:protocatechuate 3,4-dioxygenase subunit alpha [Pseudoclavibacter endophyticus]|uniref:Protocatechuate 3,4-dioxygenase subunit alpha n=1 Tax=Pseudoclavibacter endophyticus TaxID=1778590 RepID=A0A6H9WTL8_9MICO|nr:protocatechuate 3,4-dioxygenase subunit alpha [Pseudoclavibacter endophyticus]KAB1649610.1 protocatechuate 3,4-dioxygenase subunit alpha [Pseudoclavibacter endophyticus]GGA61245.1 protocatechuate 3,4-dioxygenase subunit alpha [Pseudoclavibacter endophyticus]